MKVVIIIIGGVTMFQKVCLKIAITSMEYDRLGGSSCTCGPEKDYWQ